MPYNDAMAQIHSTLIPKTIQFTEEGYQKLLDEAKRLNEKRPATVESLRVAREMGDLSENGAYKAARFELSAIDRELRRVNNLLRYGVVVKTQNNGTVQFGSTVTISDGKKDMTFMLVEGFESDPKEHKLSMKSPIGHAVFGKKIGENIVVTTPSGLKHFTVTAIS
jgi:transcription elongation factor GreA